MVFHRLNITAKKKQMSGHSPFNAQMTIGDFSSNEYSANKKKTIN